MVIFKARGGTVQKIPSLEVDDQKMIKMTKHQKSVATSPACPHRTILKRPWVLPKGEIRCMRQPNGQSIVGLIHHYVKI